MFTSQARAAPENNNKGILKNENGKITTSHIRQGKKKTWRGMRS